MVSHGDDVVIDTRQEHETFHTAKVNFVSWSDVKVEGKPKPKMQAAMKTSTQLEDEMSFSGCSRPRVDLMMVVRILL